MDLLRGSLGVSLRNIRVSGRALLGGRILFVATVDDVFMGEMFKKRQFDNLAA